MTYDHITTEAVVGDYFRLPFQPVVQVLSRVDLGDYVTYIVQAGNNAPEQWDLMKLEAQLEAQERDRIEAEENERIIYEAATQEISLALELSYDWQDDSWLTEPIGSNPDVIFGKQFLVVCHECNGEGCSYCGYGGLKPELQQMPMPYTFTPIPKADFRFCLEDGTTVYQVILKDKVLGWIEKIRNQKEFWLNTPSSYYWEFGDEQFSSPLEAANRILATKSSAA